MFEKEFLFYLSYNIVEKKTMITYKFRLYPNKSQQSILWKDANRLNRLYNYFLDQRIETYKNDNKTTKKEQQSEIVKLKKEDDSLKRIHSQVLQQVTDRLDKTYKSFFKRGFGFPRFRSCSNFFGITYPQSGYSIKDNVFKTKAYSKIKFKKHRNINGNIKQVSITNKNDQWFINIVTDYNIVQNTSEGCVGVDVGITNIAATSEGEIIKNKNHARYFDKQINGLKSRRDMKCKKKSRKFRYLSKIIKRLYGVKIRKINDFQHKVSRYLSRKYDTIICEDLNSKRMSESKATGLNRENRNSRYAKFISYLEYKSNNCIKVNPYNTSKMCNNCGKIHEMKLKQRIMKCDCGYKEDRDINAAKNIYCLGQAILELRLIPECSM